MNKKRGQNFKNWILSICKEFSHHSKIAFVFVPTLLVIEFHTFDNLRKIFIIK